MINETLGYNVWFKDYVIFVQTLEQALRLESEFGKCYILTVWD